MWLWLKHFTRIGPHTVFKGIHRLSLKGTEWYKIKRSLRVPELLQKGSRPGTHLQTLSSLMGDEDDSGANKGSENRAERGNVSPKMWVGQRTGCRRTPSQT